MSKRPQVCVLLDAIEKAPRLATAVALFLVAGRLAAVLARRDPERAWRDIALYAHLAAGNEKWLREKSRFPARRN